MEGLHRSERRAFITVMELLVLWLFACGAGGATATELGGGCCVNTIFHLRNIVFDFIKDSHLL